MGIEFSKEQIEAITTRHRDILVSAAAGSGKTAVLVERIIGIITDSNHPTDIDRLLVVTFTDAAASEMRQRISQALAQKMTEAEGDEIQHLQKQALLLHKASITTIHSFCLSVIRQNFHLTEVDPAFTIGEAGEIRLLKSQVLKDLFEEEYAKENNEGFTELVEIFGNKLYDDGLQNLVLETFDFINSSPNPESWLTEQIERYNISRKEPQWFEIIKEDIGRGLESALRECNRALKLTYLPDAPKGYADVINSDREMILNLLETLKLDINRTFDEFSKVSFKRMPSVKGENPLKAQIADIRDTVKSIITDYKTKVFFKSPEAMKDDLKKLYPIMKNFADLVLSFKHKYTRAKLEKNIVDFNDLEHYCLQILSDNGQPSSVAAEYKERFEEILIDEYQDSNPIQETILSLVARENPPNRFMVGDIKQSIYKFRLAKPELFIEKYTAYSYDKTSLFRKIDLSQNFRSRANVLDFINFIFVQLMTPDFGKIPYDDRAKLYFGAEYYSKEDDKHVEVLLIERKSAEESEEESEDKIAQLTAAQLEAKAVANHINQTVNGPQPLQVLDKETGTLRPVRYGDIVIILRSLQDTAGVFEEELKNADIPAFVNTQGGFFETPEIMTMLSILQIIDNPRQDIHLICVLFSPIYGITPDELVAIREVNKNGCFYDCITASLEDNPENETSPELKDKLQRFITHLKEWRKTATFTPISQLIFKIYMETSYFDYAGAMTMGQVRQRNLRSLVEMASRYESTSYKGLFHFMGYVEKLQKSSKDAGDAPLPDRSDDVVRILTIHKSKGLEFPVVYVSMLGKQFNKQDQRRKLLMHQEYGLGSVYIDTENRIKTRTLAYSAIQSQIHKDNYFEELRCLYVALTRAKEKLILTASASNINKKQEFWKQFQSEESLEIPPFYLLKTNTFLDWIMPALLKHKSCEGGSVDLPCRFTLTVKDEGIIFEETAASPTKLTTDESKELSCNSQEIDDIKSRFERDYAFASETLIPVKLSISEIKRINQKLFIPDAVEFYSPEKRRLSLQHYMGYKFRSVKKRRIEKPKVLPSFLKEIQGVSKQEIGTALHTAVEHIDLNLHTSVEAIKELISQLVSKQIIAPHIAEAVPVQKLYAFTQSPLAKRMRSADFVNREVQFVLSKNPQDIYRRQPFQNATGKILVHGIIDCFFTEKDGVVLVDYKSDYVGEKRHIERIKKKYAIQLQVYKEAIERSTGLKVKESLLYLFHKDLCIDINKDLQF